VLDKRILQTSGSPGIAFESCLQERILPLHAGSAHVQTLGKETVVIGYDENSGWMWSLGSISCWSRNERNGLAGLASRGPSP
jgi:hypothetical protein